MWSLEYELIAILLLAAIIGLIMGRFLCKSGESEEKIKKEKVTYAFNALQSDVKKQLITIEEQQDSINEKERNISDLEQTVANLSTRLVTSDAQSQTVLEELKVLEKYKMRFEALNKEFDVQVNFIETLKAQKRGALEKIEKYKVEVNRLEQSIINLEEKNSKIIANQEIQEKHLDALIRTNKNQDKTINELSTLKEKNRLSLEHGTKREALMNQQLQENSSIIEQLKDIEEEYHLYKESFNKEKLLKLEEHLEKLYVEREDLISRLRAISSVVNAVGVEEED